MKSLPVLKKAVDGCRGCELYANATRGVFGSGPAEARIMFVGEQPGNDEDRAGEPFVGPAGRLFDKALAEAGIDRREVFVTNVVKHFKWIPKGKRRIHQKPSAREIAACRPWLDTELEVVKPEVIVCLGATATQALVGRTVSVTKVRGERLSSPLARIVVATVHPSSILRAPDDEMRRRETGRFIEDLRKVVAYMREERAAAAVAG